MTNPRHDPELRAAGFRGVDCFWKHENRAIFGGSR